MKFHKNKLSLLALFIIWFSFLSCKETLPVPNVLKPGTNLNSSNSALLPPNNVIATHGKKKEILLSWKESSRASSYFIYKADSPHDQYIQIDEIKAPANFISIPTSAGYSAYFKIAAADPKGKTSELSLATFGTALATPIITSIEKHENGATVYWFMENLNKKSYLDSIQFLVSCYNTDGSVKEQKIISSTTDTFCTFENLHSGTLYSYDVEAYLLGDQTTSEKSIKVNSETLVSLIPSVPEFSVTEGTKENSVDITITLPPLAKIITQSGNGSTNVTSYDNRPLYFKIERFNPSTNSYELIEDYLNFKGTSEKIKKDSLEFENYKEGDKITFTDSFDLKRGTIYKYRVRSFTDNYYDTNENQILVTHDASKAYEKTGWAAAIPFLSTTETNYTKDQDGNITDAKIKFLAHWNSNGKSQDYSYLIIQNYRKLKSNNNGLVDTEGTNSIIQSNTSDYFSSIEEINNTTLTIDLSSEQSAQNKGYYSYTLFIVPNSFKQANPNPPTDISILRQNCLTFANDPNSKLITNEGEAPYPENFKIEDGFKDKVKISFTPSTDSSTTYKLIRKTLDENGQVDVSQEPKVINLESNASGYYEDTSVESGSAYQYTLYASTIDFDDIPSPTLTAFTLKNANVYFDPATTDYSSITVTWDSAIHIEDLRLNGKDSHNLKYVVKYNNHTLEFFHADFVNESGETTTLSDSDGFFDYTISYSQSGKFTLTLTSGIHNFDYSSTKPKISLEKAGMDSPLEVRVENDITLIDSNNFTSSSTKVRTLGANQISLTTTKGEYKDKIYISWLALPGINSYVIKRTCPKKLNTDFTDKTDIIYINSSNDIFVNGDKISSERIKLTLDGSTYTLEDIHCTANDNTSTFQMNQEKIAYGLEFEYTVTPIKSTQDNPFEDSFQIEYTAQNSSSICKKGYTIGYGINVSASKSEYNDTIEITWNKPNSLENKIPYIWYKPLTESNWNQVIGNSTTETKYNFVPPASNRTDQFEFFITYDTKNNIDIKESYSKYLASTVDSDGEQNNVGYSFSIENFNAIIPTSSNESFSEIVNWSLWDDTDSRKKKPGDNLNSDCYEIQIMNLNNSNKWNTIATISKNGQITLTNKSWFDVKLEKIGSTGLKITALNNGQEFTSSQRFNRNGSKVSAIVGTHNGLLKVQRDYKHYYRFVAKRINSKGNEVLAYLGNFYDPVDGSTNCADSMSKTPIYTYRKITDDEFLKGFLLIIADATYQQGVTDSGTIFSSDPPNNSYINGAEGKFCAWHQGSTKNYYYGTHGTDYQHIFRGGVPGNTTDALTSGWKIKSNNIKSESAADGVKVFHFNWGGFTVTHSSNLPSYSGTIFMFAGRKKPSDPRFNLALQYSRLFGEIDSADKICVTNAFPNDTSYNDNQDEYYAVNNNEATFKTWFPFQLGANIDSVTSFNANIPVYQNTWWEVKE